jgi:fructose-bisphosphate aldolase class II
MPIATPDVYNEMLDRAKERGFAYPAINVTSSESLNAAIRGYAEAGSDGIVQISTGGAAFLSGQRLKDMVTGAVALAEFAHVVAAKHPVNIALHTDHCPKDKLDGYMDDVVGEMSDKLYSTPEDALRTAETLGTGERGRYLLAATFGNVHGVYKPGHVKLRPELLNELQQAVGEKVGKDRPFDLVFHGGSGSLLAEIREAIGYGVIKMNVDTDTQYALTRPIVDHMFKNYDGVLKVDGDVGVKKTYDPRTYMAKAEGSMAARVVQACEDLQSAGNSMANA